MSMSQTTKKERKKKAKVDPTQETRIARINPDIVSKISTKSKRHERFALVKFNDSSQQLAIPQQNTSMLRTIKSIDDLVIDTSKRLGYKIGDLNLIHSSTYRCRHH